MNREKTIRFINRCLERTSDTKLRLIAMVAYHIMK